jgi:adenylyltransferase/sulfurtransferase
MDVSGIQAEELKQRLDAGEDLYLLDVREEYEYEISNIGGHLIPLGELPKRINELDASQEIIALCKMGPRGARAVEVLHQAGFDKVRNLTGGIRAWSDRVDPKVRKY